MFERKNMEVEFGPLFDKHGYGTTIWSPLCGGVLTGKYNESIPEESRGNQGIGWIPKEILNNIFFDKYIKNENVIEKLRALGKVAEELGVS